MRIKAKWIRQQGQDHQKTLVSFIICNVYVVVQFYPWFNPLSPKSDRHQISPYNINALENRVVMRIE